MDKRACITFIVPGNLRTIAVAVILADLARKLGDANLASGRHEIVILGDGSVALDGAPMWKPKPSVIEPKRPKQKAG